MQDNLAEITGWIKGTASAEPQIWNPWYAKIKWRFKSLVGDIAMKFKYEDIR